jgi:hypothetical protein
MRRADVIRHLPLLAAAAVLLTLAACQPPARSGSVPPASLSRASSPAVMRAAHDPGHVTGMIHGPCHARDGGRLPDPRCTPGGYDPAVTKAVICAPGFTTAAYRPPASETDRFKYGVAYPAYGLARIPGVPSELDHLVPLELGGANDASNLWPEPGRIPNPKDAVEGRLHREVCAGKISLRAAQQAIAADWETAP